MPIYTVQFFTEADWAEDQIDAATPQDALDAARRFAEDEVWNLNFQSYDNTTGIEHFEVRDATARAVAAWHHPDLILRLAAPDLLRALERALMALNTAPRFRVPQLSADSYMIAAECGAALAKAKSGATG